MERLTALSLATMAIIAFLLVLKSSVIALSIWLCTTWPERSEHIATAYRERPWRCLLIGLANTVVLVFIGLLLTSVEPLALIGLLLLAFVACLHLWGRSAAYRRMATKLGEPDDGGLPRALVMGGVVTELMFLLPVIGQVLYLGTTLRGMGAVVVTLVARGTGSGEGVPPLPVPGDDEAWKPDKISGPRDPD